MRNCQRVRWPRWAPFAELSTSSWQILGASMHRHAKLTRLTAVAILLIGASCTWACEKPAEKKDRHGDPLPMGAIARLGTIRWVHGGDVRAVAYSPDGKLLASAGDNKQIRLWDAETGKEIKTLEGHTGATPAACAAWRLCRPRRGILARNWSPEATIAPSASGT